MLPKHFWRWLALVFVVSYLIGACVSDIRDANEWQRNQVDPAISHATDQ